MNQAIESSDDEIFEEGAEEESLNIYDMYGEYAEEKMLDDRDRARDLNSYRNYGF